MMMHRPSNIKFIATLNKLGK